MNIKQTQKNCNTCYAIFNLSPQTKQSVNIYPSPLENNLIPFKLNFILKLVSMSNPPYKQFATYLSNFPKRFDSFGSLIKQGSLTGYRVGNMT